MSRTTSTSTNSPIGPQITSVASAVGFSTGDLIYRTNSGYGRVPDGSVVSATFPNSVNAPVYSTSALETTQLATDSVNAGGQNDQCAARLTNGNIVVVYTKPANATYQQGFYYFRVVDTAGAVVVAETIVDATNYSNNSKSCSVVALSGGGFAVGYRTSNAGNNYFYFRSFDNNGSATSSPVLSTSFVYSTSLLVTRMVARTDGGYIFAGVNSSSQAFYFIRTAVSGQSSGTTVGGLNQESGFAIERFSDNSFITLVATASTTLSWDYRNAAGTSLNSGGITVGGSISSVSACRLNTDTIAIYIATNAGLQYCRITQGGTPTALTTLLAYSSPTTYGCAAYNKAGTNTNIVLFSYGTTSALANTNIDGGLVYYIVDGSTGLIQGAATPRVVAGVSGFLLRNSVAFVEFGSTIRAYVRGSILTQTDAANAITAGSTHYINFNSSTFVPESFDSAGTKIIGNTTEQAVNLYSRSGSTPSAGSFASAASVDVGATITQGTAILPQTTIEAVACNSYQLLSLSTGNILALYKIDATNIIKFAVLNNSGVVVGLYPVATGIATHNTARACELSNGNIVIAYQASSTKINYVIYSPSFVLQSSGELPSLTTMGFSSGLQSNTLSIAALTQSNRFVVGFVNGGGAVQWNVYSSTATIIAAGTQNNVNGGICCIPTKNGGFALWYSNSSSAANSLVIVQNVAPVNADTYFVVGATNLGSGSFAPYGLTASPSPNGYIPYFSLSGTTVTLQMVDLTGSVGSGVSINSINNNASNLASCCTAEGVFTTLNQYTRIVYAFNTTGTTPTLNTFSVTSALPSIFATNEQVCAAIAPFYGPYIIIGTLNASRFPTYAVVASRTISYPVSLTAGVSASNPTTLPTSSFALVGVGVSDCAAGGVGQVQTSGTAVLSSSYPSTTSESFDFTNPATYGVKGAINGRVITMES